LRGNLQQLRLSAQAQDALRLQQYLDGAQLLQAERIAEAAYLAPRRAAL
jgi:hypothetical protein